MSKYSKKAQQTIEDTIEKYKKGTLRSGKNNQPVRNRKQAIAIGISEARRKHYKTPSEHN